MERARSASPAQRHLDRRAVSFAAATEEAGAGGFGSAEKASEEVGGSPGRYAGDSKVGRCRLTRRNPC
jgi:hypothetical protein